MSEHGPVLDGHDPPAPPDKPKPKAGNFGGSPGLLTSTGGLFGINFQLLCSAVSLKYNRASVIILDVTDFDTEEAGTYFFKQEEAQQARAVDIHKVLLSYRDLGIAKFKLGFNWYSSTTDKFYTKTIDVTVGTKEATKRIRTKKIDIKITGEMPQLFHTRKKNSGPYSITKITLCGNAAEEQQV